MSYDVLERNQTISNMAPRLNAQPNTLPNLGTSFGAPGQDNRSCRVSFEKLRKHLPGFKCVWDARREAKQLYDLFKWIDMTKEVFEYRTFTRLKQLEYLIRTQQIDHPFFWINGAGA